MSQQELTAAQEWKQHWPMVFAAMIGMSFYTVVSYSHGVFIQPLEREFGWARAEISAGLTAFFLITMVGSPFIGAVIDKLGSRRVAILGMFLSSAALSAFSLATGSLTVWFALWIVFALCSLPIKSTIWSASVSSVFTVNRGLALSVALSGTAIGQALSPIIADWLITDFGWRSAFFWLGIGWGGIALVLLIFFFYDIRDVDKGRAAKQQAAGAPAQAHSLPGLTLREGLRDSRILRIGAANLILPLVGSGVSLHMVPIVTEAGLDTSTAAKIAATAGIAGLAGKIVTGWLLDRFQGNLIPVLSFAIAALGYFLFLNLLDSTAALTLGAMILGYASGAGFQVTTYLISRYAGMRAFGTIFGLIGSVMMLGSAIGPTIAGFVYDQTGGYAALLMTAIPVALLAALMFVGLGPYPKFASGPDEPVGEPQPAATG